MFRKELYIETDHRLVAARGYGWEMEAIVTGQEASWNDENGLKLVGCNGVQLCK